MKPKLVAKSVGSETSPWKIKKNAPKISAKDVPANLRSLFSCALWRLHESIDRNDANELFLLCDQSEIRTIAQKLNTIVRSSKELGVLVAAKARKTDLDVFGDLEREFNVQSKDVKYTTLDATARMENSRESQDNLNSVVMQRESSKDSTPIREEAKAQNLHSTSNGNNGLSADTSEDMHNRKDEEAVKTTLPASLLDLDIDSTGKIAMDTSTQSEGLSAATDPPDYDKGGTVADGHVSEAKETDGVKPAGLSNLQQQDLTGTVPESVTNSHPQMAVDLAQKGAQQNSLAKDSSPIPPPVAATNGQAEQEPEDSDEEVVVFVPQPKRFSNQKKPAQHGSRPSTPVTQAQKQLPEQGPKLSPSPAQVQSKHPARGRNSLAATYGHSQPVPQPTSTPTVIDPDAFGRSFAVNPNPSSRTLPTPRSNHRPRSSAENAQLPQGPRSSRHRNITPRRSPGPPKVNGDQDTSGNHGRRASPTKQVKVLERGDIASVQPEQNHVALEARPSSSNLAARMVNSEEFIPRSAFKGTLFGPIGNPPSVSEPKNTVVQLSNSTAQMKPKDTGSRSNHSSDFTPRSPLPLSQSKASTPKPQANEQNGFVPRNAMPTTLYKPRMPEPDIIEPRASMPDVQYILKSGSTRAATRGRGRLWTPS